MSVIRLVFLALLAAASLARAASACNIECNAGEAYNDEAELCIPVGDINS
jgi:hypothetical protein